MANGEMEGIAWIDVESTGVDPYNKEDKLLQVACIVTDAQLNILDEKGVNFFVKYSEEETQKLYDMSIPYVQAMHNETGLWDKIKSEEALPLETVDELLREYLQKFYPNAGDLWFGGNSVYLDRSFLEKFTPKTYEHIHYRTVDVTSFAGPIRKWFGFNFPKKRSHDAMEDILESINELKAYKKLFVEKIS